MAHLSLPAKPSLSVVVITLNEEAMIERCLRSVPFADQWVVLDSGSTDRTVAIAEALGAEVVIHTDWQGFGRQKNRALDLARGDWVLSLDADEYLSEALRDEIQQVLLESQADAYSVPRRSSFCGQFMRGSGWYPDRVTRLFRRGSARFSDDLAHERVLVKEGARVTKLKHDLLHESYVALEEVLQKMNRYSTDRARDLYAQGQRSSLIGALAHGAWAFVRAYLLRRGCLDGKLGLVLALSIAEGTYYRHLKLWLLHNRSASNTAP